MRAPSNAANSFPFEIEKASALTKTAEDFLFPCGFNTPLLAASPHRERFCVRLDSEPCTVGRNSARLGSQIA